MFTSAPYIKTVSPKTGVRRVSQSCRFTLFAWEVLCANYWTGSFRSYIGGYLTLQIILSSRSEHASIRQLRSVLQHWERIIRRPG